MSRLVYLVALVLAVTLTACTESSPPEGDVTTPPPSPTPPTFSVDYLRLDLTYDSVADTMVLRKIVRIKADELPRASGPYMALAYVGSELVGAQFVPFADEFVMEVNLTEDEPFSETIPVTEQPGTVFLKWQDGIDRIDIRDDKGVALTIDAKDIPSDTPGSVSLALEQEPPPDLCVPEWPSKPYELDQALIGHFPHITLPKTRCDLKELFSSETLEKYGIESHITVTSAGQGWYEALLDALKELSPNLLHSIHSISLARFHDAPAPAFAMAASAGRAGNNIFLDITSIEKKGMKWLKFILAHEATHCYQYLIDKNTPLAGFPEELKALIKEKFHYRDISGTLSTTWKHLFNSAKKVRPDIYGEMYYGMYAPAPPIAAITTPEAIALGFTRAYGSANHREDLATFVEPFYLPSGRPTNHPYCKQFKDLKDYIPSSHVLAIAKLNLVWRLELITDEQYADCTFNKDPTMQYEGFALGVERGLNQIKLHVDPWAKAGVMSYDSAVHGKKMKMLTYIAQDDSNRYQFYVQYPVVDSGEFHTNPLGFRKIHDTQGELTQEVWTMNHFSWIDVVGEYGDGFQLENFFWKLSDNDLKYPYIVILRATPTCVTGYMYNVNLTDSAGGTGPKPGDYDDADENTYYSNPLVYEDQILFSWFRKGGCKQDSTTPTTEP